MGGSGRVLVFVAAFLSAYAAAATAVEVRIDGTILRKASGKLVFSLSEFELDGAREVAVSNRRTGESRVLRLSSIYADSCYSEPLPPDRLDAFRPEEWFPHVTWRLADNVEILVARLDEILEHQNALRLQMGRALLDEKVPGSKVSPRASLNKLEKFSRIGAAVARAIRQGGKGREGYNPFRYPIRIQSSFNPSFQAGRRGDRSPQEQLREVLFWNVYRTLTQQLGISDSVIDLVYDAPGTTRRLAPLGEVSERDRLEFEPTILIGAESIDAVLYLSRQQTVGTLRKLLRLKMFRDEFIRDRPAVDVLVNEGKVIAVAGGRLAVSFVPPFMRNGETLFLVVDENAGDEIPVILADSRAAEGYTLTEELSPGDIARVRPGMTVRRK